MIADFARPPVVAGQTARRRRTAGRSLRGQPLDRPKPEVRVVDEDLTAAEIADQPLGL
jgi:hypothetical protein